MSRTAWREMRAEAARWRGRLQGLIIRPGWRIRAFFGGPTVEAGARLRIDGRLIIGGAGHVVLGDDVIIALDTVLYTHTAEARIEIGGRVFLNGTRVNCARSVRIGSDSIVGQSRILDTDFHPTSRRRRTDKTMKADVRPVEIAENVWIGAQAAVLKGVTIGRNAVVAYGAVVVHDVAADRIVGGNPSIDLGPVPD